MDPEISDISPSSMNKTLLIIGGVLVLALIVTGIVYWFFVRQRLFPVTAISSYEECVQSVGSQILGNNAETCVTADGRSFSGETPDGTQTQVLVDNFSPVPVVTLVQECPDEWIVEMETTEESAARDENGQPIVGATSYRQKDEYMMIGGQRYTLAQVDGDWIRQNCQVTPTTKLP